MMGYACTTELFSGSFAAKASAKLSPLFAPSMPIDSGASHGNSPASAHLFTRDGLNAMSAPKSSGGNTFNS